MSKLYEKVNNDIYLYAIGYVRSSLVIFFFFSTVLQNLFPFYSKSITVSISNIKHFHPKIIHKHRIYRRYKRGAHRNIREHIIYIIYT